MSDPNPHGPLRQAWQWLRDNAFHLVKDFLFLVAGIWVAQLYGQVNATWALLVTCVAFVCLMLVFQIDLARLAHRLKEILHTELRAPWQATQYSRRRNHFVEEKQVLARFFVTDVLRKLVDDIRAEQREPEIRLILDSGTTLTPVFHELALGGLHVPYPLTIYTNNLAGIDEIENLEGYRKLQEETFTLLGGTPLTQYRATTGEKTQEALNSVFTAGRTDKRPVVTIGVITANWLLATQSHDKLFLCARGRGHNEFKEAIARQCDRLVILTPLGKILCLNSEMELNDLIAERDHKHSSSNNYKAIELEADKKNTTYLVTTRRPNDTASPLRVLSDQLFEMKPARRINFTMWQSCPTFFPSTDVKEIRAVELPHAWTRSCTQRLFGEVQ